MGERTGISWTDHTLNAWIGCHKVSPACESCYAEVSTPTRVHRARGLELWGLKAARHETRRWEADLRAWDRAATRDHVRRRVFCMSLADIFEDRRDLDPIRDRLLPALASVQSLDVLMLTKRIDRVEALVPREWLKNWPAHCWLGCTVEDKRRAAERLPHLIASPAAIRFVSAEPLLEEIDLSSWMRPAVARGISWVIAGGESGGKARRYETIWANRLAHQCKVAGVWYFHKQIGARPVDTDGRPLKLRDSHGADVGEWPDSVTHLRQFPVTPGPPAAPEGGTAP